MNKETYSKQILHIPHAWAIYAFVGLCFSLLGELHSFFTTDCGNPWCPTDPYSPFFQKVAFLCFVLAFVFEIVWLLQIIYNLRKLLREKPKLNKKKVLVNGILAALLIGIVLIPLLIFNLP